MVCVANRESSNNTSLLLDILIYQILHTAAYKYIRHLIIPGQISQFLLRPYAHHLAWIALTVSSPEAEFTRHIFVSVFEYQNRGLVHFDGTVNSCVIITPSAKENEEE